MDLILREIDEETGDLVQMGEQVTFRRDGNQYSILRRAPFEPDRMSKIIEPGISSRDAAKKIYDEMDFYTVVYGDPVAFFN